MAFDSINDISPRIELPEGGPMELIITQVNFEQCTTKSFTFLSPRDALMHVLRLCHRYMPLNEIKEDVEEYLVAEGHEDVRK